MSGAIWCSRNLLRASGQFELVLDEPPVLPLGRVS